jgi:hypothetical protein
MKQLNDTEYDEWPDSLWRVGVFLARKWAAGRPFFARHGPKWNAIFWIIATAGLSV